MPARLPTPFMKLGSVSSGPVRRPQKDLIADPVDRRTLAGRRSSKSANGEPGQTGDMFLHAGGVEGGLEKEEMSVATGAVKVRGHPCRVVQCPFQRLS